MNNCAACRHWRPFVDSGYESGAVRAHKLGLCERIEQTWDLRDQVIPGPLASVDGATRDGCLRTNAAFGCMLWEQKT
jgi:hypothetical protein